MSDSLPDPFLAGTYKVRGRKAVGIVLFCGVLGGIYDYFMARGILEHHEKLSDFFTSATGFGIFGLFLTYLAAKCLWRIVTNHEGAYRIDMVGISYGVDHWPWSEIRWIEAYFDKKSNGMKLRFGRNGIPMTIRLSLARPLTVADCLTLMMRLREFLCTRYPDVEVRPP